MGETLGGTITNHTQPSSARTGYMAHQVIKNFKLSEGMYFCCSKHAPKLNTKINRTACGAQSDPNLHTHNKQHYVAQKKNYSSNDVRKTLK